MDIKKLVREPKRVHAALRELENSTLVTTRPTKIYIPVRYAERGLAEIGAEIYICGIFAMVVDGIYLSVSLTNAMMRITPTAMLKVKIEGDDYYEFSFDPGATVVANLDLVKIDTLVYRIFDEFFSKGRIPWFIGYDELGKLFNTAKAYANANLGSAQEVMDMLASIVSRDTKDRVKYYRQTVKNYEDMATNPPAFISLRSIPYAATNTTSKIAGSYFRTGTESALNRPSDRIEKIEEILRR